MNRLAKLGLVIGGYIMVCLAASGAVYVYQLFTQDAASQASAGMYAFGDLILFVGVFGVLALFPTGLAAYFLLRKFLTRYCPGAAITAPEGDASQSRKETMSVLDRQYIYVKENGELLHYETD